MDTNDSYEVRVDGARRFRGSSDMTREIFWLLADEAIDATVELAGPEGVIDFIDEGGCHA